MGNIARWQALEYVRILTDGLDQLRSKETAEVFVLPPATLLRDMATAGAEGPILFGAQNFHWEEEGEFTGELSLRLATLSVGFCSVRKMKSLIEKSGAPLRRGFVPSSALEN
jgi:triosephosphate isomerase